MLAKNGINVKFPGIVVLTSQRMSIENKGFFVKLVRKFRKCLTGFTA